MGIDRGCAVITRLLIIGCVVGCYMRLVSPALLTSGAGAEAIVMGGWFVGVVPIVLLLWRLP
jgi:hypothetical protein